MGSGSKGSQNDVVLIQLPAPNGWKKLLTPKKIGASKRNEVVFLSPSGEEIKSKRQLDQYLKSHSGGPPISEFDWSAGETPRRSKRISEKSNATEMAEKEPPRKKQSQSHSKKGAEQKKVDIDGEGDAEEKDDAEDVGEKSKGETSIEKVFTAEDTKKDSEPKTEEIIDEMSVDKSANLETANKTTSDSVEEKVMDNLVPTPGHGKTDEAEKQPAGDAPSKMENKEAGNMTKSDAKEERVGSDLTLWPEDNKEQPEKQPAQPEAPPLLSAENKIVSSEEEVYAKVEKEPEETTVAK